MQMMLHQPADTALQVAGGIYQSKLAGFWRAWLASGGAMVSQSFKSPQVLYMHPRHQCVMSSSDGYTFMTDVGKEHLSCISDQVSA